MKFVGVGMAIALSGLAASVPVAADEIASFDTATRSPQYMRVFGNAQPPYGFVRFCDSHPEQCNTPQADDSRFQATPERLSELDEINRAINSAIEPVTDTENYGMTEFWTIPKARGDCEDFVLLKRQRLMERGWPASSLLITVVRDEKNDGHAILAARTSQGDFILDNKIDAVRLWNQTPYHYVMRQSYIDPKVWVSLDPSEVTTPSAMAGVQSNP